MIKFGRPVPADVEARLPALIDALAGDERLEAIWLFGSHARNEADALSDIDLAMLARGGFEASAVSSGQLDWISTAARILGTDEIGIQIVNHLPVVLRHGVLRDARILWSRSPEAPVDLWARTLKEYLDLKPYLDRYDDDLFRQAATGTLR